VRTWERSPETVSKLKKKLDVILSSQKRTSQLAFPVTYGVVSRVSSFPTFLDQGETQESLEFVKNILEEACENKHLAPFDELVKLTGLVEDVLKHILSELQRMGLASQPRPDMWKPLMPGRDE